MTAALVSSTYVCPAHLEPVTWRGHGCTRCAFEYLAARERRLGRSAARRDALKARAAWPVRP